VNYIVTASWEDGRVLIQTLNGRVKRRVYIVDQRTDIKIELAARISSDLQYKI
jgi:hypothetical protein